MAIHQKLQAKLSQKLILTPSLQQAIKLLPMSTLELADMLNQEVVENPLLEEIPSEDLQASEAQPATDKADEQDAARAAEGKTDNWEDNDYEYYFSEYLDDGYRSRVPTEVKELPPIENTLSTSSSLTDHLEWQLSLKTDDPEERAVGIAIIGNLDDNGELVASVSEIAQMGPWPIERVEQTLRLVQTFDPTGVAARDLQECLTLQLRALGLEGTPTERIVTEHLRLLQNHQIPELSRKMAMTHRGFARAYRSHPPSRSEARRPLQRAPAGVRDAGRLHRQGRRPVRGGAQRRWPAATAHQFVLSSACSTRIRPTPTPAPTSRSASTPPAGC